MHQVSAKEDDDLQHTRGSSPHHEHKLSRQPCSIQHVDDVQDSSIQINLVQVMTSQTQRTRFSELGIRNSPINAIILMFEDNHSQFTMLELVSISGR